MTYLLFTLLSLLAPGLCLAKALELRDSTPPTCTPFVVRDPIPAVSFEWPHVFFQTQLLATVVVQINTVAGYTTTTTRYGTATSVSASDATGYITDETSFWNSLLTTTGIVIENGTPTLTLEPTIYTDVGEYITITTALPSPEGYYNKGFLAYTANEVLESIVAVNTYSGIPTTAAICTEGSATSTFALTPTITPSGFTDPYQVPIDDNAWTAMLPADLQTPCLETGYVCIHSTFAPYILQTFVSALTSTTTEYDDYVHSQSTSQKDKSTTTDYATTTKKPAATGAAGSTQASTKASTKVAISTSSPDEVSTTTASPSTPTEAISTEVQPAAFTGLAVALSVPSTLIAGTSLALFSLLLAFL